MDTKIKKNILIGIFISLFIISFVASDVLTSTKTTIDIDLGNGTIIEKRIQEREWWKTNFVQYETKTREVPIEVCDETPIYETYIDEETEEEQQTGKIIDVIKTNCKTIYKTETYEEKKVLTDADYDAYVQKLTQNVIKQNNQTTSCDVKVAQLQSQINLLTTENNKIKDCAKNSKDFAEYKVCIAGV